MISSACCAHDLHLFGVDEPGTVFLFGTDQLGRDVFSRIMYGARISLSVGFLGVVLSFIFGCLLGGVSGLFGGGIDTAIQRLIEFLISLPTIPLWMALAAAIPIDWPAIRTYFMITVILSILGWTELARVVRGKVLELREEDYVMAASVSGSTAVRIITRHLLPNFIRLPDRALHAGGAADDPRRDRAQFSERRIASAGGELGGRPAAGIQRTHGGAELVAVDTGPVRGGRGAVLQLLGDGLRDAADPYQ